MSRYSNGLFIVIGCIFLFVLIIGYKVADRKEREMQFRDRVVAECESWCESASLPNKAQLDLCKNSCVNGYKSH